MANQDLLKQAIAEAKAIREAAISNAKDVMEESLTPHLKDMLAAKLQEMEAEEMDETVEEEVVEEESVEEGSYNKDEMDEEEVAEVETPVAEEDEPAEDESEESEDEAEAEEGEEEDMDVKDMEVEDLKSLIRDIIAQEMGHGEEEGMEDMSMDDEEGGVEDMVAADDEEINLDELLAELEALSEDLDEDLEEEVPEESVEEMKHDDEDKMEEEVSEEVEESTELNEALATIETLRNELSEVNLLNSKLLYVNKIFKANNLSEAQKVNIITTFDKAETVKEVKLVYETVAENITSVKSEKTNLKEHKSFASKATGNSTKGEVISEVSEQVRRMQRLAGIIK